MKWKTVFVHFFALIIFLVLLWKNSTVLYGAKAISNLFASGRSMILKPALFFSGLICASLLYHSERSFTYPSARKHFLYVLSAGFLIITVLNVTYILSIDTIDTNVETFVDGNGVSATNIYHNHIGKTGFGWIGNVFNLPVPSTLDYGSSYAWFVPKSLSIVLFVIILSSIVLSIPFVLSYKEKGPFIYILVSIATFSLIKNLIDGGLFFSETTLFAIPVLLLCTSTLAPSYRYGGILISISTYIIVSIDFPTYTYDHIAPPLVAIAIATIYIAMNMTIKDRRTFRNLIPATAAMIICLFLVFQHVNMPYYYLQDNEPIEANSTVGIVGFSKAPLLDMKRNESIGNVSLQMGVTKANTSYYELSNQADISPHFSPLRVHNYTCHNASYHRYKTPAIVSPCQDTSSSFLSFDVSVDSDNLIPVRDRVFCPANITYTAPSCFGAESIVNRRLLEESPYDIVIKSHTLPFENKQLIWKHDWTQERQNDR